MREYKQWTPYDRSKNLRLYHTAMDMGLIEKPCKCRLCGQDKGIIQSHCTDYDISLNGLSQMIDGVASEETIASVNEVLLPVCWTCHMMMHKKEHHPKSYNVYVEKVKQGFIPNPIYRKDAWEELDKFIID